ncbi:hypothetical protein BJX64DRAFT_253976 [Aspergillus heterothallicus]
MHRAKGVCLAAILRRTRQPNFRTLQNLRALHHIVRWLMRPHVELCLDRKPNPREQG